MKTPVIQTTSSYDLFKPHGEQRPVNQAHVRQLTTSMQENGFIAAHPIHVYREGNAYRIIDGHHRHAAAKAAGVHLHYVATQRTDADLIAVTNHCVKKWVLNDFIRMYASKGIEDYSILASYVERGVFLKLASAMLRGERAASGNSYDSIQNGTFKIRTRSTIDSLLNFVNAVGKLNAEAHTRSFMNAAAILLGLDVFSASTFISRLEANPRALTKCAKREQMLEQIEEIYNFRARDKINLAFIAEESLKTNQLTFGKAQRK